MFTCFLFLLLAGDNQILQVPNKVTYTVFCTNYDTNKHILSNNESKKNIHGWLPQAK